MPHTFPQRTAISINCNRLSTNSPKNPSCLRGQTTRLHRHVKVRPLKECSYDAPQYRYRSAVRQSFHCLLGLFQGRRGVMVELVFVEQLAECSFAIIDLPGDLLEVMGSVSNIRVERIVVHQFPQSPFPRLILPAISFTSFMPSLMSATAFLASA